ncbi:FAD-binding domain-containing protein [Annulohypoxylon truncatum]|uniref:FAD-binding domain-containing protein n=1 Tax=Annulohypoxylon truncatum TaxID=327061 RepID=UPI002007FB6D|nr:FAD-binding domain-containing protein [Annulohypoxylon truncatum]KAI1208625.1 FAD-binding domain-containing protein [Annulohypoxylon truncatum]
MHFNALLKVSVVLALSWLGYTQTIVVDGQVINANESTISPAFVTVNASSSNATADLFLGETHQLTDAVLANLTDLGLTNITLFGFADPSTAANQSAIGTCKTFPGELVVFPGQITDRVFDLLLGGSLIQTKPLASPCYSDYGNQDAAKCDEITAHWSDDSYIHTNDPTSINAILFEGTSCVPHNVNPYALNCTIGAYPTMSVNVTTVSQIQLAINMARSLNLRLVIKNTGHDYSAKSTGAGAVSLWTHNLKEIKYYEDYEEGSYRGPAFKMGSGVQVFEAYKAAHELNLTIVGAEGKTVGLTGGYILGGGHSPLSSLYGMAADQVLSMELVTADGRFVTASEISNPDLFWALRGGGGSTFGVVTSMVIKAFPEIPVTTMSFSLSSSEEISTDQFWEAVRAYFKDFAKYTDAGNYAHFNLNATSGNYVWDMAPWFAPNMSKTELEALAEPFFKAVSAIGLDLEPTYQEYTNFYDAWDKSFPLELWGSNLARYGSRLFPRENWEDPTKLSSTFDAIRHVVDGGGVVSAYNVAAAPKSGYPDNAVNPAWRKTVLHAIDIASWTQDMYTELITIWSNVLTSDWGSLWRSVSPGSGAYLSESDYIEPDFQQSFWGDKYDRLYELKKKIDPWDVFYAQNAVGSENWEMSDYIFGNLPSQNSRLCLKGTGPSQQNKIRDTH